MTINCDQNRCAFLKVKNGCKACASCNAPSFLITPDCDYCHNCRFIEGFCRWDDDNIIVENEEPEKEKENEDKELMIMKKQ